MDPRSLGAPAGPSGAGDMSPDEILQAMLQLATLYGEVAQDHGDALKVEKARTLIQQILADHQATGDQMMGGQFAAMRRLAPGG